MSSSSGSSNSSDSSGNAAVVVADVVKVVVGVVVGAVGMYVAQKRCHPTSCSSRSSSSSSTTSSSSSSPTTTSSSFQTNKPSAESSSSQTPTTTSSSSASQTSTTSTTSAASQSPPPPDTSNDAALAAALAAGDVFPGDDDDDDDDDDEDDDAFDPEMEYKLALVVRQDLKMGKGKMCAQSCHGAVGALLDLMHTDVPLFQRYTRYGQPKVVLKVTSEADLLALQASARALGVPSHLVVDAGRTQVAPNSKTVLAVGPARKRDLDRVTGHLKLL